MLRTTHVVEHDHETRDQDERQPETWTCLVVNITVAVGREGGWLRDGRAFEGHDTNQGRNGWLRDPAVLNLMIDDDVPLSRCSARHTGLVPAQCRAWLSEWTR